MYSCLETICRWFTSSLSVSKNHFSFRKHEPNKNKHIGDRGSLNFWRFSASCSYKKVLIKKSVVRRQILKLLRFNLINKHNIEQIKLKVSGYIFRPSDHKQVIMFGFGEFIANRI